jgi:6,7-dimethyl-8-ribityllumazine synthase
MEESANGRRRGGSPRRHGACALILVLSNEETMNQHDTSQHTSSENPPSQAHVATALLECGEGRIAFVQSSWHKGIVDQCRAAFEEELARHINADGKVDFLEVPGSLEIPLLAQLLAKTGRYLAIVAAGFVVDGGIYRHEFVAATVIDALMRVQLDTEVPIISAVLTPQRFHEHDQHQRFFRDHLIVKGQEAAVACARTIANIRQLQQRVG